MRISDWSSDVCSSDLLALGIGARGALDHPLLFAELISELKRVERIKRLDALWIGEGHGSRFLLDAAPSGRASIGRASGRGRVCQYVEISVVGVFVKKKKV